MYVQVNTFICAKPYIKEKHPKWEKLQQCQSLITNIKMYYKKTDFKADCFVDFFHMPEKIGQQKNFIPIKIKRTTNQNKICYKRNRLKSCLLCLLLSLLLGDHDHAYCCTLFESVMKTGCEHSFYVEKIIALLHKHNEQQ